MEIGARLYSAIFPQRIQALFERSLEIADREQMGLRLKIFLNPRDKSVRFLQGLPWELLFRKDHAEFLALSRSTPVVRSLAVPRTVNTSPISKKLRILAAQSLPPGVPALDLDREIGAMDSSRECGSVEIVPWRAQISALRETLDRQGPFDVLHFMGHGQFLSVSQQGALLFEKKGGGCETVTGPSLAEKLRDFRSLRLVVLNACQTARTSSTPDGNPFGGVAASLVQAGFPAVLAMQEVIEDDCAITLSRALYRSLASGQPIEVAVAEARQAVLDLNPSGFEWAIPCLFLRTPPSIGTHLRHSRQEAPSAGQLLQSGIEAFRAGSYPLARQVLAQALAQDPGSAKAQLFDILARMAMGAPLSMKSALEVDKALQVLLSASDPLVARLARLALAVLRHDVIEPRYLKIQGMPSSRLFAELEQLGRPDAFDREIAQAIGASSVARTRFKLHS
ncbi:MAG TPA: CHAT domain-containing protein [Thermoanaerobaculia bacterium]|nr:CHAT domain-containing protein [Thermoanaerobaculia bacterium]